VKQALNLPVVLEYVGPSASLPERLSHAASASGAF